MSLDPENERKFIKLMLLPTMVTIGFLVLAMIIGVLIEIVRLLSHSVP